MTRSSMYGHIAIVVLIIFSNDSVWTQHPMTEPHGSVQTPENGIAESAICPHAVYFELLGQGLLYSVNYEYMVHPHVSLRAGFTIWEFEAPNFSMSSSHQARHKEFAGFPLMINLLAGDSDKYFELGIGIIPTVVSKIDPANPTFLGTGTIGYRSQPREGGFLFRIGLTPVFTFHGFGLPWIGVSFGHTF